MCGLKALGEANPERVPLELLTIKDTLDLQTISKPKSLKKTD